MDPYQFQTNPFPHQREELERHCETPGRMILWEQGVGKSKVVVDTAAVSFLAGRIDAVVVVAPNGVHRNWVEEEIPTHTPEIVMAQTRALFYQSEKSSTIRHQKSCRELSDHPGLIWFAISYEAFTTTNGKKALIELFHRRKVLFVLDEAHYINNPTATRTVSILRAGEYAKMHRVLTGTPISTGPFNMYTLAEFVSPGYWERNDLASFAAYRNHFAVLEKRMDPQSWSWDPVTKKRKQGREFEVVKTFRRLDELRELLRPLMTRVTKESAGLNLPPKRYRRLSFQMTPEQSEVYRQMHEDYLVWLREEGGGADEDGRPLQQSVLCFECGGSKEVEAEGYLYPCPVCVNREPQGGKLLAAAEEILKRQLRLQQITSGYLPTEDDSEPTYTIPGANPRLEHLRQEVSRAVSEGKKVIVWARFQLDITLILAALKGDGVEAVRYDGLVGENLRAEAKARFKGQRAVFSGGVLIGRETLPASEQASVFVANPAAGATGLTLNVATVSIYYSNSFKLIERLQSEDRNHRIGQDKEVEYIDLIARGTIDEDIVSNLRSKFEVANQILGDGEKAWI